MGYEHDYLMSISLSRPTDMVLNGYENYGKFHVWETRKNQNVFAASDTRIN